MKNPWSHTLAYALLILVGVTATTACTHARDKQQFEDVTLMNVSFDASRPFFASYNKVFAAQYQLTHRQRVTIKQTHGGSGKQARAVIDGLPADVVSLALSSDIDAIAQKSGLVDTRWKEAFPTEASPFSSTIVLLVRKGNPKQIRDFSDLTQASLSIIAPNPKTSGGARLAYFALFVYAMKRPNGSEATAQEFLRSVYAKVPVMDAGARASLTTFLERGMGDVLLAWENEALYAANELAAGKVDVVWPSMSILATPPVAVVDKVAQRNHTKEVARAYLAGLWEPQAQELAARSYFRPRTQEVLDRYRSRFPSITLFRIRDVLGDWDDIQHKHFDDGGVFDQIAGKR